MDSGQYSCVGDVPTIPRQQVFYPMMGDDGNVQRIMCAARFYGKGQQQ